MKIKPHQLAASEYSILALFLWASWWVLLSPPDRTIGQLQYIFAPNYENRTFFVFFALSAFVATILAILFWMPRSGTKPLACWLAYIAVIFFAIAIWLFDFSVIFGFGLGCMFAIWSYFAPNNASN